MSTKARDRIAHLPRYHVPRMADDTEVQEFLEGYFLEFRPDHARAHLNADEVFDAAKQRFGLRRCDSVEFWIH